MQYRKLTYFLETILLKDELARIQISLILTPGLMNIASV